MDKRNNFRARVWRKTKQELFGSFRAGLYTIIFAIVTAFGRFYVFGRNSAVNYLQEFIIDFFVAGGIFAIVYLLVYLIFIAPYMVGKEQEKEIDELKQKLGPPFQANFDVKPTPYPQTPPHRKVGILIENHEIYDLTDISIRLIKETDIEMDKDGEIRPTELIINGYDYYFDLGSSPNVSGMDKRTFYLAEIRDKGIAFLVKDKPIFPKYRFPLPQVWFSSHYLRCEFYFEIRGKIKGDPFKKEMYFSQVRSYRVIPEQPSDSNLTESVSIDIDDVIHIADLKDSNLDAPKNLW